MATFAKSTFSAAGYATFRPSYPPSVYQSVLAYHQGPKKLLLDLGSGHGLVSRELAPSFTKVIGTDPSHVMIKQAISSTPATTTNISFRQATAESLPFIADGSIDMVVAGQAAHWFDYSKVWPELKRTVREDGTLAFWGYKDHVFVDYPKASAIWDRVCYGDDAEHAMGKYWEQPGRNILRNRLRAVVPPEDDWKMVTRLEYEPGTKGANTGEFGELLMHRKLKLGELMGYARTFSALHGWQESHPDRMSREKGGPGDIIDEAFDEMLGAEPEWKKEGDKWMEKVVEVEWGSYILMAQRK